MYYLKTVEERIRLLPKLLSSELDASLLHLLRDKFERRIFKDVGFVLSIDHVKVESEGLVIPGDNAIYYTVRFDALCFMPSVNEVYLGEVKETVEFGAFISLGALQGLLHVSQLSKEKFYFDKKSKSLSSRDKKAIKKGDFVIAKVSTVSLKGSTTETKIGLTMRPDGLGKKEWLDEKKKPVKADKTEKVEETKKEEKKESKKESKKEKKE